MRLFKVETSLYCCKQRAHKGELVKGIPYTVDYSTGRYAFTDHYALEAWERMTQGGVTVSRQHSEFAFGMHICEALVNGEEQGMFLAAR